MENTNLTPEQLDVLTQFKNGVEWDFFKDEDLDEIVRFLLDKNFLTPRSDIAEKLIVPTQSGRLALYLAEKEAEENTKHKKQQKFDNRISIIGLVFSGLGLVAGIVLEYWAGIVEIILKLFGR